MWVCVLAAVPAVPAGLRSHKRSFYSLKFLGPSPPLPSPPPPARLDVVAQSSFFSLRSRVLFPVAPSSERSSRSAPPPALLLSLSFLITPLSHTLLCWCVCVYRVGVHQKGGSFSASP